MRKLLLPLFFLALTSGAAHAQAFEPARARAAMERVPGDILNATPDIVWSADGARVAILNADGAGQIFDAATGKALQQAPAEAVYVALGLPAPQPRGQVVRSMFPMYGWNRREMVSPDGQWWASLVGDDVAVRASAAKSPRRLTRNGGGGLSWFLGGDIWEDSGDIWSPDSTRFVARSHDSRRTPPFLRLNDLERNDTAAAFRYWGRAGDPLPTGQLHVVNARTGQLTPILPTGDHDSYVFFIEWSPDGRELLWMRYSRDLMRQDILVADARTGRSRLLRQRVETSAPTQWPSGPRTIQHLPGGKGYLLRSDESGNFQLYLLDKGGKQVRQLTTAAYDITAIDYIDASGRFILARGAPNAARPYDEMPLRIGIDNGAVQALAGETGVHAVSVAPRGGAFVTTHSDIDRLPRTDLRSADGRLVATLGASTLKPGATRPRVEAVQALAADGRTRLHGVLLYPKDFDSTQRYPVIQRVYGGAQSHTARYGYWGAGLNWSGAEYYQMLSYFAENGFAVLMIDTRGTPGRGRDFQWHNYGDWPGDVVADSAAALTQIAAARPWMDLRRVGVEGNSWGGAVALQAVLDRPDLYRAASLSVPETRATHSVAWIEWLLGTPSNNPKGYAANDLFARASELKNPLLLVAGSADVNVPVVDTMLLLDSLAEAGKPYELVLFPGTNHPHQGRGDRYAYAVERIRDFFNRELAGPTK